MAVHRFAFALLLAIVALACSGREDPPVRIGLGIGVPRPGGGGAAPSPPRTYAAIGDSNTYGYGLATPATDSWPAQLGVRRGITITNYGINGKTIASAGTGVVTATGTGPPPTVTVSGSPTVLITDLKITIDIMIGGPRGTATFRWSMDGSTWQPTLTTAASVVLPGSGITATFAVGTYNADNLYTAAYPNIALPPVPATPGTATLLIRIGTNDFGSPGFQTDAEVVLAALDAYVEQCIALGYDQVFVLSISKRGDVSATIAGYISTLNARNVLIYGTENIVANTKIGDASNTADPTYFQADTLHLAYAGHTEQAVLADALMTAGAHTAPYVDYVVSPQGSRAGGNTATIKGYRFRGSATASIGGFACTSPTIVDVHTITGVAPNFVTAGVPDQALSVSVTCTNGSSTKASAYFSWHPTDYSFEVALLPENITQTAGVTTGWTNVGTGAGSTTMTGSPVYSSRTAGTFNGNASFLTNGSSQLADFDNGSNFATGREFEFFFVRSRGSVQAVANIRILTFFNAATTTDFSDTSGFTLDESDSTSMFMYRNAFYAQSGSPGLANVVQVLQGRWTTVDASNTTNTLRIAGTNVTSNFAANTAFTIRKIKISCGWTGSANSGPFDNQNVSMLLARGASPALTAPQLTVTRAYLNWRYGVTA